MAEIGIDLKTVLAERAQRLADAGEARLEEGVQVPLLLFELGQAVFGVEPTAVREVFPVAGITPVPLAPPELAGLVNLHGVVLPAVDLGVLFQLGSQVYDRTAALVAGPNSDQLVLLVGFLRDLQGFREDQFCEPPSGLPDHVRKYVSRCTTDGVAVLDLESVLADPALQFAPRTPGGWT